MSPLQRSLKKLRDEGWMVAKTEHWNAFSRTRQDLFGFIDLLALRGHNTLALQVTSGSNSSAREQKIRGLAQAGIWLAAGNRIVIHAWAKRGPRGQKKVWTCRETEIK